MCSKMCLYRSFNISFSYKKTKVKLELLTDIDMILMIEKGIRRGISHRYSNANDRYMKDYDKNKKSSYL